MTRATIFAPWQDDLLREHYTAKGAAWCARELGMTSSQVTNRAFRLGVQIARAQDGYTHRLCDHGIAALVTQWRVAPGALDREDAAV